MVKECILCRFVFKMYRDFMIQHIVGLYWKMFHMYLSNMSSTVGELLFYRSVRVNLNVCRIRRDDSVCKQLSAQV